MLAFTRKRGQAIVIGNRIEVMRRVPRVGRDVVRTGVTARAAADLAALGRLALHLRGRTLERSPS